MPISHFYWHLVVNNGNSHIFTDIYRSSMRISDFYWHLVINNGNFILLLTSSGPAWQISFLFLQISSCQQGQFHISTDILWSTMAILHFYWHLVSQDISNFTIAYWTSCSQQWQCHPPFTDTATESQNEAISHFYWHLVVNNGNFILLLTSSQVIRKI